MPEIKNPAQEAQPAPAPEKSAPAPAAALTLSDPRDLLTRKPMPTRAHTFKLPEGGALNVLLQGLTYTEKSEVDQHARERKADDEKEGISRPSMWGPTLLAKAMRRPDGSRPFKDMEWIAQGLALAEQLQDGVIQDAVTVVLDLSGYSKDAVDEAGKGSRRTSTSS